MLMSNFLVIEVCFAMMFYLVVMKLINITLNKKSKCLLLVFIPCQRWVCQYYAHFNFKGVVIIPIETPYAWGSIQNFSNTIPFTAYRMLVMSQRGLDIYTQFSEIRLFGFV
jgi:hypothetical protein